MRLLPAAQTQLLVTEPHALPQTWGNATLLSFSHMKTSWRQAEAVGKQKKKLWDCNGDKVGAPGCFTLASFPAALPPLYLSQVGEKHKLLHEDTLGSELCASYDKEPAQQYHFSSRAGCAMVTCMWFCSRGRTKLRRVQDPAASPAPVTDKATQHGCIGISHRPLFHSLSDTQSS